MSRIAATVTVARPPGEVFTALTDWENLTRWIPGAERIEKVTPGASGVGTRVREIRRILGHPVESQLEVTAWQPGRQLRMRLEREGTSGEGGFDLIPVSAPGGEGEGGTRIDFTVELHAGGFKARLLLPILGAAIHRQMEGDLAALKRHLEGGDAPSV